MDVADSAQWALTVAFSRDDIGHTDWNQAAAVLAGACALPGAEGLESRALSQAMELAAERFARISKRPALSAVQGEGQSGPVELLGFSTAAVRHGGLATTYLGLTLRTCELAGRALESNERVRLTRIVRSVLTVKELDRYLGGLREAPADLPASPTEAQPLLEAEAVAQLAGIQPDQIYKGARVSFISELVHGVVHAYAVHQILRLVPGAARPAVARLAEQLNAQRRLVELRGPQQFDDDLEGPSTLGYLEVLGTGFDDPEKLQFACAARELWAAHGRPEEWVPLIGRTLAALE